jgi:CRISPR-associated protein Cas1
LKQHLNTLFVTTQKSYLRKEGEAVVVRVEKETKLRVPLHNLGGIVCFGRVGLSPALMGKCGEAGVAITLLNEHGRFRARITGFTPGNVLLRREQYRRAEDPREATEIARNLVAAKIANCRSVVGRMLRDHPEQGDGSALHEASNRLGRQIEDARAAQDVETARGVEGEAANTYFGVFDNFMTVDEETFRFTQRSRRPPLDSVNALLSFVYAMLGHDARAACEAAGLDPEVGFLHADRPGRPGLALDLMEPLRPFLADRLVLSLINRAQVKARGFEKAESGAVRMDDETRKTVLTAYQNRKQETITHPFLREKTTVGLIVHLQARLLTRYLRGELDTHPAFIWS